MDSISKERLSDLRHRFDLNYRLSQLYASYLGNFPELITKEMIDELTRDGSISKKEALVALLSEIFGLDDSRGGDDRQLIRKYISPSVTLLDKVRYTENPYCKNIKTDNIKDGDWEIKRESYPPYRAAICGDIVRQSDGTEYAPLGFFEEEFSFLAVLEGGNEWMTLTPVDIDTSEEAIAAAHGNVVTFGLGLGYYAYMASEKPEVKSVTIVEINKKAIELFKRHLLPQFPHKEKISIVNSDAFLYAENEMPKKSFDLAFVDTWRDASDGAPMYIKMKEIEHLSPNTKFLYWIEEFLRSRLRAQRFEELYKLAIDGKDGAPESYREFLEKLDVLY